jgi:hypothetical protein
MAADTESPEEREAREFISTVVGLSVSRIKASELRTADYEINGDSPGYLVEVKSRNPPRELVELQPATHISLTRPLRHDDAVGSWLAEAKQQMKTVDPTHARLWFVWGVASSGFDPDAQAERIVSSLYGFRRAIEAFPLHRGLGCYYAQRATFDRFPEIDGVIVYRPDGSDAHVGLNLNEASPRLQIARACKLTQVLKGHGLTPTCPSESAKEDEIVVPRGMAEKDGEAAVLRYVQKASGIPKVSFWAQEVQYIGAVAVSLPDQK